MSLRSLLVLCGSMVVFIAGTLDAVAAGNLYRYRDSNGTLVIGATIPPDRVKNGYEILSSSGRVLEVVPRALTPEEIAAREAAEEEARKREEEARKQAEEDEVLLRLYGSPEGAMRMRDRRLQEIEGIISLKRGSMQVTNTQIKEIEAQAATVERSGRAVPEDMREKLDRLRSSMRELERDIAHSEQEYSAVEQDFKTKIERLEYLKTRLGERNSRKE